MNDGWTIDSLTADQIVLAKQAIKQAANLSEGSTFFKSGDLCTVSAVSYDGVVSYYWPDGDGPYFLHTSPENDEQFCDWSDVEIAGDEEAEFPLSEA